MKNYLYIDGATANTVVLGGVMFALLVAVAMLFYKFDKKWRNNDKAYLITFAVAVVIGFVLRIFYISQPLIHADVETFFIPWTESLVNGGISNFYYLNGNPLTVDYFHDYTPLYMYVLWFVGHFVEWFNMGEQGMLFMQRLPAVIADTVAVIMLFKCAKLMKASTPISVGLALFYFFAPAVIVDSAVWGQVDGITAMFFIITFYFMLKQNDTLAIFFAVVGMCFKLQFIFVAPAIGIYYLYRWDSVRFSFAKSLKGLLWGLAFFFIVNIPFTWKSFTVGDIMFPFKIYGNQIGSYSFYSLNTFNFWGALGYNYLDLPINTLTAVLNLMSVAVPCLITIVYFHKKRDIMDVPLLAGFVIVFTFTFSFKMHERYMFGAIIALVLALAKKFNWYLFIATVILSLSVFYNIGIIMVIPHQSYDYGFALSWTKGDTRVVLGSLFHMCGFVMLAIYMIKDYLTKPPKVNMPKPRR